ncbi:hypothetical protein ETAA8_70120 [Anatilimnocola aggregata]|uniref:Uncharacterized protein n=2 Tax=Anatilimnocola aggregata TaxID=2528021 RepID=A0A517YNR3_9BACT|nr:hypothetical protein ETAA8_70120 [Anatilimnocola aggregata]
MVALEIVLLAFHLACMNVAAGGPLVGLWLEWKDRRGDGVAGETAKYLGAATILALFVGALLGLIIGWLRWTPDYQHIWQVQLSRKLNNAILELGVTTVLLIVYWAWRRRVLIPTRTGFVVRGFLLLFASTNLLYHFPPLLIVAGKLQEGAFVDKEVDPNKILTPATFRELLIEQETPAMTVHFALASVAMAGLMLIGYALRRMKQDDEPRNAKRIATWGGWAALGATGLQLIVGLWLLATTPTESQAQLTGSSLLPSVCLGLSLALVVWLLRELADVTMGDCSRKSLVRSMIAMTAVILLMTAARQLSRPQIPVRDSSKLVRLHATEAVTNTNLSSLVNTPWKTSF